MVKKAGLAILVCAVMVLVAAVPLVAGTTLITKGEKGPNASAVTWEYVPTDYGIWTGHITNKGLRWLVIDVYDNTNGALEEKMHQRIRFAAYDAFPNGNVTTNGVVMAKDRIYSITATPNGPRGTNCTVEDLFKPAMPPVAIIAPPTVTGTTVSVDGSASYDPDAITPPGIVSWSWDWGDGTTGTGKTATHTYQGAMASPSLASTGKAPPGFPFIVAGYTRTADGVTALPDCTVTVKNMVTLESATVVSDGAGYYSVDINDRVLYPTGYATNDPIEVTAVKGDLTGTNNGLADDTVVPFLVLDVTLTGTGPVTQEYTITLTVTDDDGLTGSAEVVVQIETGADAPPVASFTADMSWMTVSVVSTSTDDVGIAATDWAWGDGMTGSGETATHEYATPGLYTITLTVTDTAMQTDTASQQVEAKQAPPVASFTKILSKRDVSVDGSGSSDPDGTVDSWSWNWGDNSALDSGSMATHLYASIGTFTITLTVTDNDGLTGSSSQQVTTSDSPPTASFTVTVDGASVSVDASDSGDDYGILSYDWKWGDDTTGTGKTATHTYPGVVASPSPASTGKAPPGFPFIVAGYTHDADGVTILPGCTVTIKNMRTLESSVVVSDSAGYYSVDINERGLFPTGYNTNDPIEVTAVKGDLTGTNNGLADDTIVPFLVLDITLVGAGPVAHDFTITLTVTDALGQTDVSEQLVTVYY